MVVGHPDYKNQRAKVPAQLEAMRAHYGELVLITLLGNGPSYVASGWAVEQGVYFAEVPNLRGRYGAKHPYLAASAMLALRPALCVTFGACPEAEAARAAGVPTYEV